jgi:hypothetical protein
MKETILNIFYIVATIILLWVFLSWINVICHNSPGQDHSLWSWNFFTVVLGVIE